MPRLIRCAKCGAMFTGHHLRKYCDVCRTTQRQKDVAPFVPYGVRLPMVFCMNCGKETLVRHPDEVTKCRFCGAEIWRPN